MEPPTVFIHQCVIIRRPYALNRSGTESPVKVISQRTLPATATVLKRAGGATVLLVRTIAAIVGEVTHLLWSITAAFSTNRSPWRTEPWKRRQDNSAV